MPNFTVSKVAVSHGGNFVGISGQHGVSVMEMPMRWGSDGVYQDGKLRITCQTFSLHEHSVNHLEVIQTRWHPNSPTDSHLLVLMSDNSIRIYDEGRLKHVWRVGPVPNYAAIEKNFSYLRSLGDTAVDFDIAPAKVITPQLNETIESQMDIINQSINSMSITSKNPGKKLKIEWPIVILRGNGNIFVLNAGLDSDKPRLQGPLTMVPQKKDNYGDDSCSLLVIPTLPPTLVIAENSGVLHHALMIESCMDDSLDETRTILRNDWDLYVLETIQLELGLPEDRTVDVTSSPLLLKRDVVNEQRYFCYHDTGLHGITVGFIQQLQGYVQDDESEAEPNMNVKSRAEYILSTKAFNSSKVNGIVGIGLLQSPSGIFAIMSSGQIVSLNTIKLSLAMGLDQPTITKFSGESKTCEESQKPSFDQHIRMLLKSEVSQPILKLDRSTPPTARQTFDLLTSSIDVLREQFKRHDKARQEIAKRVKILEMMKLQQKDDIEQLLQDKELIQEKAYKLADMHEDIMERQQNLQKRIQDILRLASLQLPSGSSSEKDFAENIKRMKSKTDKLLQDVKQVRAKNEIQKSQLEAWNKNNENSTKSLPPKQEEAIKEILTDMTKQISTLQKDFQKIQTLLDV